MLTIQLITLYLLCGLLFGTIVKRKLNENGHNVSVGDSLFLILPWPLILIKFAMLEIELRVTGEIKFKEQQK